MLETLFGALLIFILRVMNYAIGTVRLVAITRQRKYLAAGLAACEAFVFAVVIGNIVKDLDNLVNLFAYCAGASGGSLAGMYLESRFITGYVTYNVILQNGGHVLAEYLRDEGFGVTEAYAEGREGQVTHLRSVVNKRDLSKISKIVKEQSPDAFVTIEEARGVQRGWIRAPMPGRDRML